MTENRGTLNHSKGLCQAFYRLSLNPCCIQAHAAWHDTWLRKPRITHSIAHVKTAKYAMRAPEKIASRLNR